MQQYPSYGRDLGYRYPNLSQSMVSSLPSNYLSAVFYITWEIIGFSHQFLIAWENATKPILWEKPGIWTPILFPKYGWFFTIKFPPYSTLHHMWNKRVFPSISLGIGKFNKSHPMQETCDVNTIIFPKVWLLLFPWISHRIRRCSKIRPMSRTCHIDTNTSSKLLVLLFHQVPIPGYITTPYGWYMSFPSKLP